MESSPSASVPTTACTTSSQPTEPLIEHGPTSSNTTTGSADTTQRSSYRIFREQIMLKPFETRDKLPLLVVPGVFIGSLGAAANLAALQSEGITHILCVAATVPLQFPADFIYERLALADDPETRLDDAIASGLTFIDRALADGGRVLVHCLVGKSRSASIVLAFLMARHGMTLDAAMALLKRVRPRVQPNRGFLTQLRCLEHELALANGTRRVGW